MAISYNNGLSILVWYNIHECSILVWYNIHVCMYIIPYLPGRFAERLLFPFSKHEKFICLGTSFILLTEMKTKTMKKLNHNPQNICFIWYAMLQNMNSRFAFEKTNPASNFKLLYLSVVKHDHRTYTTQTHKSSYRQFIRN